MNQECPPIEALRRLGDDTMAEADFKALEAHVSGCAPCQELLEHLARSEAADSNPFVGWRTSERMRPPQIPGFAIGAELGRGGGGVVYEALQLRIGRPVAIKVLDGSPTRDRDRERWLREARAVGRVRHPHVVRLHEAGEHDGRLYLVLDLVPGGSLKDRAGGPMPPRSAAILMESVCRAVEAIHREGLLHLDIKPSNILLDGPPGADWGELSPVLSDFGIALREEQAQGDATTTGAGPRGTPAFMAPEQIDGRLSEIGPPADVFALGATLYTLLTGRPPFQGASAFETIELLRSSEPARPRSLVPGVPRDLETICLEAIRKEPSRRYGSAEALADDLRRWLDGFPIRARRASGAESAMRWCRRHPSTAALGGALVATAFGAIVGLAALWRHAGAQRDLAEESLARAIRGEAAVQDALGELVGLITSSVEEPQQQFADRVDESLPALLELSKKLRGNPRLAGPRALEIAELQSGLATLLEVRGDVEGSWRVVDDAAGLMEAMRRDRPGDVEASIVYADLLLHRGMLDLYLQRTEAVGQAEREAAEVLEPLAGDPRALPSLTGLEHLRVSRAEANSSRGEKDVARRILDENAASFERLWRARPGDAGLRLLADLSAAERDPSVSVMEAASRSLGGSARGREKLPPELIALVGFRIAVELYEGRITTGAESRPSTEEITGLILGDFERLEAACPGRDLRFAAIQQYIACAGSHGITARRAGRLDETRWIAGWMRTVGESLVRRDANDVCGHLMLSKAHEQLHKVARQLGDGPALEPTLKAALAEGTIAYSLMPGDTEVRRHIAVLREKYIRMATEVPGEGPGPSMAAGGRP